jgi:O-antigen/teichoic acid export membrane protein
METANRIGLRSRLQVGLTWNLVGTVFTLGSSFVTNILFANILGRDVFGEYGMVLSTMVTISGIAQLATGFTATKYVAEYRVQDKEKTARIMGLCSVLSSIAAFIAAAALLLGAAWLAVHTLKAPHMRKGLMIAAGYVLFSVLNGYQMGVLAGLESYRALAGCTAVHGCAAVGIGTLAAWLWGLEGALASMAFGSLLRWYLFHRVMKSETESHGIKVRYDGIWKEREVIYSFALPTAISGFSSMPALWMANAFLVRQQDGYSQMGLYGSASNLKSLVLFLPLLLNNVSMSLLNSQRGAGDEVRYRKVFWTNLVFTAAMALAGAALVAASGKWLLRLYGKDFTEGYMVLVVLMGASIFECVTLASYQIVQAQGKMWLSFFAIALPRDAMVVVLAYLLIPSHGAMGLAISYTAAHATAFAVTVVIISFIGLNTGGSDKPGGLICDIK